MFQLSDRWTDEIAEVSGLPEYQNALVELHDPSLITYGEYDPVTGTRPQTGNSLVWSGQARFIPYRWGTNSEGENVSNATTLIAGMIQFPKNAVGRVKRGMTVKVETSDDNPTLTSYSFRITSDLQGSNAGSRTFEVSTDIDQVVSDG